MSLEQVLKETRDMPRGQVAELIDRLTLELQESVDANVEKVWRKETQLRIAQIRSGATQGIPEEVVSASINQLINS
jgi:hypothetical protein